MPTSPLPISSTAFPAMRSTLLRNARAAASETSRSPISAETPSAMPAIVERIRSLWVAKWRRPSRRNMSSASRRREDRHRAGEALELDGLPLLEANRPVAREPDDARLGEHLARARVARQARGEVHRGADRAVFEPPARIE